MTTTATPEDLAAIRAAEQRIAERLAMAARSDDDLTAAREHAARIVADAEAAAAARARSEAERIAAAGRDRAAAEEAHGRHRAQQLRAIAATRRSQDVAAVLSVVLPEPVDAEQVS